MSAAKQWKMDTFAAEARTKGEPPPDLIFAYPDCTVCDGSGEMDYDDGFFCHTCGTTWPRSGERGEWDAEVLAGLEGADATTEGEPCG